MRAHHEASASSEVSPPDRVTVGKSARERFLSDEPVEIRQLVQSSWQRSTEWSVSCDDISAPYRDDLDVHGSLMAGAAPTMDRLHTQIVDQPVAVVLTDAQGFILDRRVGRAGLRDHLDRVCLAPGFTYAEQFVGTNGIGTALEARQAAQIQDQEHFTGPLVNLTCAGVPIYDSLSGSLEGILDITCFAQDASPLLMNMAVAATQSIQTSLLQHRRGQDIELLTEYLRITRRCQDPVLAVSDNVLMINDPARAGLSPQDQTALVEQLRDHGTRGSAAPLDVELSSGQRCRVHVKHLDVPCFATIAKLQYYNAPGIAVQHESPGTAPLPGIAGSSAAWQKCCRELRRHYRDNEWVLLEGEPGVGKNALAQAVHYHHEPAKQLHVLDVRTAAPDTWQAVEQAVSARPGALLIAHLDQLEVADVQNIRRLVDTAAASEHGVWVCATRGRDTPLAAGVETVVASFGHSLEVPPLRHHIHDVDEIATLLLRRTSKRPEAHFTTAALHTLMRGAWPNNISELRDVIVRISRRVHSDTVAVGDLPAGCFSKNRSVLSTLESMERDAIIKSLADNGGNRSKAAQAVGISRATIYRKINKYGIDVDGS